MSLGPISNQLGFVGVEAALFSEDTNPILNGSQIQSWNTGVANKMELVLKDVQLIRDFSKVFESW